MNQCFFFWRTEKTVHNSPVEKAQAGIHDQEAYKGFKLKLLL